NWNLTWSTRTPIFTSCFIKIGLIWAPIAFFWIFAPAEIYYMMWKKGMKVPWSTLNISKLVVVFFLMIVSLVDIIYQMIRFTKIDVRPVEYYTPFLIFVTMVRLMKDKDRRTKLMNEIMNGIKVLKLYAWENSFIKEVMSFRSMEVASLRAQAYLSGAITFVFSSAPFLISLASFATYVLIDPNNVLDANKAFVSLSLFNILRIPTALLPMIITYTAM
ncbi:multidrug resistance-associated protein 1, partial [Nephila pilipes]